MSNSVEEPAGAALFCWSWSCSVVAAPALNVETKLLNLYQIFFSKISEMGRPGAGNRRSATMIIIELEDTTKPAWHPWNVRYSEAYTTSGSWLFALDGEYISTWKIKNMYVYIKTTFIIFLIEITKVMSAFLSSCRSYQCFYHRIRYFYHLNMQGCRSRSGFFGPAPTPTLL